MVPRFESGSRHSENSCKYGISTKARPDWRAYLPLLYHNAKLIDRWVVTGLYEAGIVRSKKLRSYLPAIILAFTEES